MQAIQLTAPTIDSLNIRELPRPQPNFGEVVIRQHAVSLNYLDLALATVSSAPLPSRLFRAQTALERLSSWARA